MGTESGQIQVQRHRHSEVVCQVVFVPKSRIGLRSVHLPVGHVRGHPDPGRLRPVDVQGLLFPQIPELCPRTTDVVLGIKGSLHLWRS